MYYELIQCIWSIQTYILICSNYVLKYSDTIQKIPTVSVCVVMLSKGSSVEKNNGKHTKWCNQQVDLSVSGNFGTICDFQLCGSYYY